jgi:hypothetical protein
MRFIFGLVFVSAGLGLGLVWPYFMEEEANLLESAADVGLEAVIDQVVVAHGTIDSDQEVVNEGLALGIVQQETEDSDGDLWWEDIADFGGPIRMQTGAGIQVEVSVADCEPRGNYQTKYMGNNSRAIGFAPGDEWLAVGSVTSVRPYRVEALHHFGGDRAAYLWQLSLYGWLLRLVGLLCGGVGICAVLKK